MVTNDFDVDEAAQIELLGAKERHLVYCGAQSIFCEFGISFVIEFESLSRLISEVSGRWMDSR